MSRASSRRGSSLTLRMNRVALSFLLLATLLFPACPVRQSIYKRFELPKGLDEASEQRVFWGVVQAMRSQPFVDELKSRFPSVTPAQLLKTDIRWDVVKTTAPSRSFFISFGVKDANGFQEAAALVDFFLEYGKAEAEKLLSTTKVKKA